MVTGELKLRVIVESPPPGVSIQVQRGRDGLLAPSRRNRSEVVFDFSVRLGPTTKVSALHFMGDFAQGPADGRFVYVCSGKRAGQPDSCWDRRAKISLGAITPAQANSALDGKGQVLEARVQGSAKDGGPLCASVPLLGLAWAVRRSR